ncbi:hypothetical protein CDL15_Pgr017992 [Punica granatum]|uniref:Uncharacterized protein n=1 Tax=Punica granatum TaxID=22663 RepID=A0A218WI05_PUNGR|nr:hypothetical protein CDL15_Pgr017992 [Punica granatum]
MEQCAAIPIAPRQQSRLDSLLAYPCFFPLVQMSLFVPRSDGSHDVDVEEKEAKEILRNDPTARGAHLGRARLPASTINGRRGAAGP